MLDGGQRRPVGVATDSALFAVDFTDASTGWVVGAVDDSAVVLHTIDGGTTWTLENMTQLSLAGTNFNSLTLTGGDVSGANLSGANLNRATLNGANLTGANLSGANLNRANLTSESLADAITTGANFNRVIWPNTTCPDGTNSDSDGGTCVGHL